MFLEYLWATFTEPKCSWDLYFLWQKQQTSKRQAEAGVSCCSCILLVLGYYWRILKALPKMMAISFRWSLANTTDQWKTETGEPSLALLALERLWQISEQSKWQWQLRKEPLWVQRICKGLWISAATEQVSQVLTDQTNTILLIPVYTTFCIEWISLPPSN